MAHIATTRFGYGYQLFVLIGLVLLGLLIGSILSLLPLLPQMNFKQLLQGGGKNFMDDLLVPANATPLRIMQFISTFFLMCLPALLYAKYCHHKPMVHLGLSKKPKILPALVVILVMLCCFPLVGYLQDAFKHLPFSKALSLKFDEAEKNYMKQILAIGRMNNFADYLVSLIMIALLPALFEEMIFRGALQNLCSRATKKPILSIVITAAVFSAIHGSYIGFLPRFVLGFVLGWMFYRTNNLWLSVVGHFVNNAIGITGLYVLHLKGQPINAASLEGQVPFLVALVGCALLYAALKLFDKVVKNDIDEPGQERLLPDYINPNNPFENAH